MSEMNGTTAATTERPEALATTNPESMLIVREEDRGDLMWDPAATRHAWNLSKALARSAMIPKHFQGKEADVFVALTMARRMNEDVFAIMQSMHVVNGKAGWSATYMIARAKRAGIAIRWDVERLQPAKISGFENLAITARAVLPGETEPVRVTVTTQQAIDAGWTSNAQYKHSCELMLTYRSATWLVRRYAPDILLGYHTLDEIDDVRAAEKSAKSTTAHIDAEYEPVNSAPAPTKAPPGGGASTSEPGPQARKAKPKPKPDAADSTGEPPFALEEPQPAFDRESDMVKISDYEASIGAAGVAEIAGRIGLKLSEAGEPVLDGQPDATLARYLAALRDHELL